MNNHPFHSDEPFENPQEKQNTENIGEPVSTSQNEVPAYETMQTEAQQGAEAQQRHSSQQSTYTQQNVYSAPAGGGSDFSENLYSGAPQQPIEQQAEQAGPRGGFSSTTYIAGAPQNTGAYEYTERADVPNVTSVEFADGYGAQYTGYAENSAQQPYQTNAAVVTADAFSYTQPGARYSVPQGKKTRKEKRAEKKAQKKGVGKGFVATTMAVGILASGVLGFGGGWLANNLGENGVISSGDGLTIQKVVNTAEGTTKSTGEGMSTAQIAEMAANSVVEITTEVVQTGSFSQQYIESGAGSGVIISENGYILTNNHVIDGASKITITLKNGDSYDAKLVGTAASVLDVALLKIEEKGLTPVVMGDSDAIKVGEKTVVIGNPLGQLGGTVTDGIVSALNRDLSIDGVTMNLLQTNAAINPGNSGGGMFNEKGELIGLVVAKSTGSEVEGLGFAIPINQITEILDDLTEYGYVRGNIELGLSLLDITSEQMAMMYGVSDTGVYVLSVNNNSGAQNAGFQRGDKLVSMDGTTVNAAADVEKILKEHKVGDSITVQVMRGGQTGDLTVTLEEDIPDAIGSGGDTGSDPFANNGGNANDNNQNGGNSIDDFLNGLF